MPRGSTSLNAASLRNHLESTGGLQLDTINVLDRAHYLTLWSRFGSFERQDLDRWIYEDQIGYEYWGHEASILPRSHLPIGARRMRRFPPESWRNSSWWQGYQAPLASRRRVLRRLRLEGPLESAQFKRGPKEFGGKPPPGGAMPYPKHDSRALQQLWHEGRVAVRSRRHFRRQYDLAERVYGKIEPASLAAYQDSWLMTGLSGNGIASEAHLVNYITGPKLNAAERNRVIARNIKAGRVERVGIVGQSGDFLARPEDLAELGVHDAPHGTTLICPFDSLLWQRCRAEQFLDFHYRIEIYVPQAKRQFGYYVLPIMHNGQLVGRLDPKCHRNEGMLEVKSIHLEEGFKRTKAFDRGLADTLSSLARFSNARDIQLPPDWHGLV